MQLKKKLIKLSFGGGGEQSKTLNDMPDNITKMLKDNYKKVAILEGRTVKMEGPDSGHGYKKQQIEIPINLTFTPSTIILITGQKETGTDVMQGNIGIMNGLPFTIFRHQSNWTMFKGTLNIKDNATFILDIQSFGAYTLKIHNIICIE